MQTFKKKIKCSICGHESVQPKLKGFSTYGANLDLREISLGSILDYNLEMCCTCGYVATDIAAKTVINMSDLRCESYRTCDGFFPDFRSGVPEGNYERISVKYYRLYLIQMNSGNLEGAFFAIRDAAWACDDINDKDKAILFRKIALPLLEYMILNPVEYDKETLDIIRIDFLRRSGQFCKILSDYKGKNFSQDAFNKILKFQIAKAKQSDSSSYKIEDAINQG